MSEEKILVTGGAGYIGSHVVKHLGDQGEEIVILDNLSTGRKESIISGKLVVGELSDRAFIENLFRTEKFSAIFHFAGSIVVPESVSQPLDYYQNNTENTLYLLQMAQKYKIKHFIFSSTAAVYGIPVGGVATEEHVTNPINPYGRTKLMTEWMLKDLALANNNFKYVALRYFNVAGADAKQRMGQWSPNSTHLIKIACETAVGKRKKMSIFGNDYPTRDGTCIRDYIHVDDLASAHVLALNYLRSGGESTVLNCGYGKGYTVSEVISKVREISGVNIEVEFASRREGDPEILISKADRIKNLFKWKPQHESLDTIISTALAWEKKLQEIRG